MVFTVAEVVEASADFLVIKFAGFWINPNGSNSRSKAISFTCEISYVYFFAFPDKVVL